MDSFVTALYGLAEHCDYGGLHDQMIRDRLVVGLRDAVLSEKLQMDSDLSLQKAISTARQSEAVKKQQSVVRGDSQTNVDAIRAKQHYVRSKPQPKKGQFKVGNPPTRTELPQKTCTRCGRAPVHSRDCCPARNAKCHKCKKTGHFQLQCRTKSVCAVLADQDDEVYIAAVHQQPEKSPWVVTLGVNGSPVEFKIDTGADVSVLPEAIFKELRDVTLQQTSKSLIGPNKQSLNVCGQFEAVCTYEGQTIREELFVVKDLQTALIGCPAIETLNLVSRINAVEGPKQAVIGKYSHLFRGLGTMEGEYNIELREDAKPFIQTTPRRVALPLQSKVKAELERMERLGVISPVDEPTDWCAAMVVVPKADGKVRICVDLTKLNESVKRERHILPSVEQTLGQLAGSKVFSKLDANSGFWQIKLSRESALLTTFITPFGRFCFNRLPFGITSAPEHFQKRMSMILTGLEGIVCMVDDVLVSGKTQEEHDKRLEAALQRIEQAGLTLNPEKCIFSQPSVRFLGHLVDASGIQPDPEKVKAVQAMEEPRNITELRRFLGMANHLAKFIPTMAETTKPLRDLLIKKNAWNWGDSQQQSFNKVKQVLSSAPTLALYDPQLETVVSADASSYGLGAVLIQKQSDGSQRPVVYASRSLTPTEQRYAQIEKEALALTWACERFEEYLLGMKFHLNTDHKPLVSILGSKGLNDLPVRVQRFRMRLMRFQFSISHVPGKELATADALSRAPTSSTTESDDQFCQEVNSYVRLVMEYLPFAEDRLRKIAQLQEEDDVCKQIKQYCLNGWPERHQLRGPVKQYYAESAELTVQNELLMKGCRIVIPAPMRKEILDQLHTGHQGITKCRERAKQSVWWPGIGKQLADLIQACPECCRERLQPATPLQPSEFPSLPWETVATDLFYWKGSTYLLVGDYLSRFIEIARLSSDDSSEVIRQMKIIFARHGIPCKVVLDNGPQFASREFAKFAQMYGFTHRTSSPRHPQGNGEAERAVRTVKCLLRKADDPFLALLSYRVTPLHNGYSPSELLMGRKLRTTVPMSPDLLQPSVPDYSRLVSREAAMKEKQKKNFDRRHKAQELKKLVPGESVWVPEMRTEGIVEKEVLPRSYQVLTPRGTLRRNRQHLRPIPDVTTQVNVRRNDDVLVPESTQNQSEPTVTTSQETSQPSSEENSTTVYRTRSGRASVMPDRYRPHL